jgi:hypothetical protein
MFDKTLTDMPRDVIRLIGSYLNNRHGFSFSIYKNYDHFRESCKTIYSALPLNRENPIKPKDLQLFPQLKYLRIESYERPKWV